MIFFFNPCSEHWPQFNEKPEILSFVEMWYQPVFPGFEYAISKCFVFPYRACNLTPVYSKTWKVNLYAYTEKRPLLNYTEIVKGLENLYMESSYRSEHEHYSVAGLSHRLFCLEVLCYQTSEELGSNKLEGCRLYSYSSFLLVAPWPR